MILIRVDGNGTIGLGHIMRCLSIADAIKRLVEDVVFAVADESCSRLLQQRGFAYTVLHTDYDDMDGEADRLLCLIEEQKPSVLIVDSYYVTAEYLQRLKEAVKVIYIDDQLSFPYPADVVINYNIFAKAEDYLELYGGEGCPRLVIGPEYAPLREEFSRVEPHDQPAFASKVLVSTGGADAQHIALKMIRYLTEYADMFKDHTFSFIIGGANRDIDAIRDLCQEQTHFKLLCDVREMSRIMLDNDIAVSAAGSTLYELCACAIPTVTYILADNQAPAAKVFNDKGIMINVGDVRAIPHFIETTLKTVLSLSVNKEKRTRMSEAARQVTDGRGADRLASAVLRQPDETVM